MQSEITRMGFQHAVINLSGGIDSALSCFLTAEALGAENVLAIRLPYRTSSRDSLEDAQKVEAMKSYAKAFVKKEFSFQKMADETEDYLIQTARGPSI